MNFAFPITARRPDARPAGTVTELGAMLQKAGDRSHSGRCTTTPLAILRVAARRVSTTFSAERPRKYGGPTFHQHIEKYIGRGDAHSTQHINAAA